MKYIVLSSVFFILSIHQSLAQNVPSYVPTNGLVGWWPFNGNANDIGTNINNGVNNGAVFVTDRFGVPNNAINLDGSSSFIDVPQTASLNITNNITISTWAYLTSYSNSVYIGKTYTNSSSVEPYVLVTDAMGRLNLSVGSSAGPVSYRLSASVLPLNEWVFLTGTASGSTLRVYINGVDAGVSQESLLYPFNGINNFSVKFGKNRISNYTNGKLDDIGIWNRALTPQEILDLYSIGCTKPAPVTLGVDKTTVRCPNDNVTIFIVTPSDPGLTYQWTRNGTNIVGATASSITVSDAAKYKVFVRSGPGVDCQRVSGLIETTAAIPPTITATAPNGNAYCPGDSVLLSATGATAGYSYQWKRFGVPIAGATSASFYATQTGNYRCEVTNAGGCINQSNLITVTAGTSCRLAQSAIGDVSVYPNPARNSFTVSFNDIGNETPTSVELRNQNGQVIESKKTKSLEDVLFNTQHLSPGIYHVRVMLESGDPLDKTVQVIQ